MLPGIYNCSFYLIKFAVLSFSIAITADATYVYHHTYVAGYNTNADANQSQICNN